MLVAGELWFVLPHKNEAASTESLTTGEQVRKTMRREQKNVFTHAVRLQVQQSSAVSVVFLRTSLEGGMALRSSH